MGGLGRLPGFVFFVVRPFGRLLLFAVILALGHLAYAAVPHQSASFGPVATCAIVVFAVFLGLGYTKLGQIEDAIPFRWWFFGGHLACLAALCALRLAEWRGVSALSPSLDPAMERCGLVAAIVTLALACLPLAQWVKAVRVTNPAWVLALLAGAGAYLIREPAQGFWLRPGGDEASLLQSWTFSAVHFVLSLLEPWAITGLISDSASFQIGTARFLVFVAKECSGLEGLGMILVFTVVWLIYFRRESRFPQALMLIPLSLVCMWVMNVLRICVLVLIGNAGYPETAIFGFHSRAGWIGFTLVALSFSVATQRLSWVRKDAPAQKEAGESPATGAYLVPFLAVLAASFVSKAASGQFEWLYPLRFFAAGWAIWHFRSELRKLDWRFGWVSAGIGTAVFLLWIAAQRETAGAGSLGASLAVLGPVERWGWIAFRVAAAGVTGPIVEELAFRGYLGRRVLAREFDAVPLDRMTWLSVGVSSVAFGLLYGERWLLGIASGLAYAGALKWRGRMGDAVAAHATSSLLLAAWVLARGEWGQW